jgi:hypothetical protein
MPENHPAGNFNMDPLKHNSRVGYLFVFKKELAEYRACA